MTFTPPETWVRTRQALERDYEARGIDAVVQRPIQELHEMKRILQDHPAYSDPKHPHHATVTADMRSLYSALHPDPPANQPE